MKLKAEIRVYFKFRFETKAKMILESKSGTYIENSYECHGLLHKIKQTFSSQKNSEFTNLFKNFCSQRCHLCYIKIPLIEGYHVLSPRNIAHNQSKKGQ